LAFTLAGRFEAHGRGELLAISGRNGARRGAWQITVTSTLTT
jgi:hypothetical protein